MSESGSDPSLSLHLHVGESIPCQTPTQTEVIPTPSVPTQPSPRTPSPPKKKRIRLSHVWDVLLLKAISAVDGHRTPYGKQQDKFESAVSIFLSSSPEGCFNKIQEPTHKTLSDRFKKIVDNHRAAVRANVAASGIIEVRGEREVLLDDIVLEMDEWAEQRRSEREEKTEFDKRLQEAGEQMRDRALGRVSPQGMGETPSGSLAEKKKRRFGMDERDEEQQDLLSNHVKERANMEQKRFKLDEERFEFDEWKGEEEVLRVKQAQEHDMKLLPLSEKRIDLEVERAALDREERNSALDERRQIIRVLGALAEKLK